MDFLVIEAICGADINQNSLKLNVSASALISALSKLLKISKISKSCFDIRCCFQKMMNLTSKRQMTKVCESLLKDKNAFFILLQSPELMQTITTFSHLTSSRIIDLLSDTLSRFTQSEINEIILHNDLLITYQQKIVKEVLPDVDDLNIFKKSFIPDIMFLSICSQYFANESNLMLVKNIILYWFTFFLKFNPNIKKHFSIFNEILASMLTSTNLDDLSSSNYYFIKKISLLELQI